MQQRGDARQTEKKHGMSSRKLLYNSVGPRLHVCRQNGARLLCGIVSQGPTRLERCISIHNLTLSLYSLQWQTCPSSFFTRTFGLCHCSATPGPVVRGSGNPSDYQHTLCPPLLLPQLYLQKTAGCDLLVQEQTRALCATPTET